MNDRRYIRAYASVLAVAVLAWPHVDARQPVPSAVHSQSPVPSRIVAVGDIHGDYKAFKGILEAAGLVDSDGAWSGGSAVLVQTGDYFDRGPDIRKLLDFLRALESSAAASGGTAHILLGNHDAMNALGEVRDANPAAYDAFAGSDSEKRRQKAFRDYLAIGDARERALGSRPQPYREKDRDKWLSAHPPGYIEYQAAMQADGEYGRWLRQRQAVLQIDGTIFLHAGINPAAPASSLDDINRTLSSEIRKFDAARKYMADHGLILPFFTLQETVEAARVEAAGLRGGQIAAPDSHHIDMINAVLAMGTSPLLTSEGPLWFRGFDTWTENDGRPMIQELLSRYRAQRFVTGHSIQKSGRISSRFDGHEFLIDTAMSSVYKSGRASALEIAGDRVTAIYGDSKVVLVEGTQTAPGGRSN
jgi:Calcineurin-like phosphoesterase